MGIHLGWLGDMIILHLTSDQPPNCLTAPTEQRDYRLQKLVELDCLTEEFCVTIARNEAKAWQDVNDINAWIQNVRGEE